MNTRLLARIPRLVSLLAVVIVPGGMTSCGGSSNGVEASPPQLRAGYAYVTSADVQGRSVPGAVYQYMIGSDGSLTPLSVGSVPAGVAPTAMISDPTGRYIYVANLGDATISQYAVGAGGGLTALSPAVVSAAAPLLAAAGYSLSVDPNGLLLYAVIDPHSPATSASIAQYSIGGDGTLTPLNPAFVNLSAAASGPLTIDPSGHYAYLAGNIGGLGQIAQFSIGMDGTLSPLVPAVVSATPTVVGVTLAPSSPTAYVLSSCVDNACDGQVAQYAIGVDGALSPMGGVILTGNHVNPVKFVIPDSGSSAYLLTNLMGVDTNTGAVYQYSIDSAAGLVPDTPPSLPVASGSVAENVYGQNLYALSANAVGTASGSPPGGHIDHYAIETRGQLSAVGTTAVAGSLATAMALVSPLGAAVGMSMNAPTR